MKRYYIIVRSQINMGRAVTDQDLKIMGCYYESPVFQADSNKGIVKIIEEAYTRFCSDPIKFRFAETVELVPVT